MIDGVFVRFLPISPAKAFTRLNKDGSHTIVLNPSLSREQQQIEYEHEIKHILNDDFHTVMSADEIEAERHGDS